MTVELTREQFQFRSRVYDVIFWVCWALFLLWVFLRAYKVI